MTINSPIAVTNDIVTTVTNTVSATNDIVMTVTNTVTATNDIVTAVTNTVTATNDIVTAVTNTIIATGNTNETTVLLASMDSVVRQSFKNELPIIITKTLISTAVKAAAMYGVNKGMEKQDAIARLIVKLATAAITASVNIADTRT